MFSGVTSIFSIKSTMELSQDEQTLATMSQKVDELKNNINDFQSLHLSDHSWQRLAFRKEAFQRSSVDESEIETIKNKRNEIATILNKSLKELVNKNKEIVQYLKSNCIEFNEKLVENNINKAKVQAQQLDQELGKLLNKKEEEKVELQQQHNLKQSELQKQHELEQDQLQVEHKRQLEEQEKQARAVTLKDQETAKDKLSLKIAQDYQTRSQAFGALKRDFIILAGIAILGGGAALVKKFRHHRSLGMGLAAVTATFGAGAGMAKLAETKNGEKAKSYECH